jgi:secreted trypsin-like serine protease
MKKISVLLILMVVFALFASPAGAMIGGELDTEHTNVGAIVMYWPQFDITGRLCSATLIHERALVTAAHCYPPFVDQGISYDEIWITFDQDALAEGATYYNVEAFIPHPDFEFLRADTHDIALVVLREPVPDGILLAQLPEPGYFDEVVSKKKGRQDMELRVVGYGTDQYRTPPDLQLDAIRRSGTVMFKALRSFEIASDPNNAILCWGDSGGPLFHVDNESNEIQIGIWSRGGGHKCVSGGFHYRLDTASALDWIGAELDKLE